MVVLGRQGPGLLEAVEFGLGLGEAHGNPARLAILEAEGLAQGLLHDGFLAEALQRLVVVHEALEEGREPGPAEPPPSLLGKVSIPGDHAELLGHDVDAGAGFWAQAGKALGKVFPAAVLLADQVGMPGQSTREGGLGLVLGGPSRNEERDLPGLDSRGTSEGEAQLAEFGAAEHLALEDDVARRALAIAGSQPVEEVPDMALLVEDEVPVGREGEPAVAARGQEAALLRADAMALGVREVVHVSDVEDRLEQ
ncbi:hypothetical protein D3C87_1124110 [compost metagenome]